MRSHRRTRRRPRCTSEQPLLGRPAFRTAVNNAPSLTSKRVQAVLPRLGQRNSTGCGRKVDVTHAV